MAVPSWRSSPSRRTRGRGASTCRFACGYDPIKSSEGTTPRGGQNPMSFRLDRKRAGRRRFSRERFLALEPLERRPLLAPFVFDPDAIGPLPAQLISGFDFLPGDALADNSVPLAVGNTFQLYYHARLGGLIDTGGVSSAP